MPLIAPNLDDRTFDEIVNELKKRMTTHCPEWTSLSPSDPGVTLLELFAFLAETLQYRMNRIPERNYIQFLKRMGVCQDPQMAAKTELQFNLTRPLGDGVKGESESYLLAAGMISVATRRVEGEEVVEFTTDQDLLLTPPRLKLIEAISAVDSKESPRDFHAWRSETNVADIDVGFRIFSEMPQSGDALCFEFGAEISGFTLKFEFNFDDFKGDRAFPTILWRIFDTETEMWEEIKPIFDSTESFHKSVGVVEISVPVALSDMPLVATKVNRKRSRISCVYVPGVNETALEASPVMRGITISTIGGTIPASNSIKYFDRIIGVSDGIPGQIVPIGISPLLPFEAGETLAVLEPGSESKEIWIRVADFADSNPEDRHFVLDEQSGMIAFGPDLKQSDGTSQRFGKTPVSGSKLLITAYRTGGGARGNLPEGRLNVLKTRLPYLSERVSNPAPAVGGRDHESVENAILRAQALMRTPERAVTREDFENLALKANSKVGRVRCLTPKSRSQADGFSPGTVRVLVLPQMNRANSIPAPEELYLKDELANAVGDFLDDRRLLTTTLEIIGPRYVFVSTEVAFVPEEGFAFESVKQEVQSRIDRYFHPLFGGAHGRGLPFNRPFVPGDLFAIIQSVPGVAYAAKLSGSIFRSDPQSGNEIAISIDNLKNMPLEEDEVLCSRNHKVSAITLLEMSRSE